MDFTAQLFLYCERGTDPSFWAEPFNAISNLSFLIAAVFAAVVYQRGRSQTSASDPAVAVLIGLVAVIGIGSFLFHTFATRWGALADTIPIMVFMFAYLAFILRRIFSTPWLLVVLALAIFYASGQAFMGVTCSNGLLPVTAAAGRSCLNGSLSYLPALASLIGIAVITGWQKNPVARTFAAAAAIFAISLTLRTLDIELCPLSAIFGRARGTHALWHLLNGAMLFLLLRAAIHLPANHRVLP